MNQTSIEPEDEYSKFLETWEPSPALKWATTSLNINDEYTYSRIAAIGTESDSIDRPEYKPGIKKITPDENKYRNLDFFVESQKEWSSFFRERLINEGISEIKVITFINAFAKTWTDGNKLRNFSEEMLSIKASIKHHDLFYYGKNIQEFVIHDVSEDIEPLFTVEEMSIVFKTNSNLLEVYLGNYLAELKDPHFPSINNLVVRRGIFMGTPPNDYRKELHYLSSYSLGLTAAEQFAVTFTPATKGNGKGTIFGAPFPAIQERVVAFAPFITNMDLNQLEIVLPPPIKKTKLQFEGEYEGISEYVFDSFI